MITKSHAVSDYVSIVTRPAGGVSILYLDTPPIGVSGSILEKPIYGV